MAGRSAPRRLKRACISLFLHHRHGMAPLSKKSGRGMNWTTPEVTRMLTAVERVLPLGMNEWDAVERHFNSDLPRAFSFRDWEAIKRKLFLLKNTLKPTGDPTWPPEVALA
ncbi:hypothetical protein PF006_g27069 [Phytophthora fragariae]|uniref:DUF6818 domain-containing protein n=2 Tax=Phytophthora fragariae TaxID=53985 RepID=A0A6A3EHV4_9STRA|nr:hypothetical protein PF009_g16816 [Phytophthora fragariae]KAE9081662.1 hypothetical protein PF006_g27069 [Phytophthora fragariae]